MSLREKIMFSRRKFIQATTLLASGFYLQDIYANQSNPASGTASSSAWFMPDEAEPL